MILYYTLIYFIVMECKCLEYLPLVIRDTKPTKGIDNAQKSSCSIRLQTHY